MNPLANRKASNGVANSPQVAMMYNSTRAVETKNIPKKKVTTNQIKLSLFISFISPHSSWSPFFFLA
jgi:hypothetical protein